MFIVCKTFQWLAASNKINKEIGKATVVPDGHVFFSSTIVKMINKII